MPVVTFEAERTTSGEKAVFDFPDDVPGVEEIAKGIYVGYDLPGYGFKTVVDGEVRVYIVPFARVLSMYQASKSGSGLAVPIPPQVGGGRLVIPR